MALQAGFGVGRILFIVGAGYTGTVLVKNGKLSDLIGELQQYVKGLEKSGERDGESDLSDAVAQQVRRLAMEVRQMASSRQITVVGGNSGIGDYSGLIVPAATLGALGYGYMWWKGMNFSDLMYVTKKSMANAVTNLTKHLEQVSDALSAAKEHLTQRIQHLDDKMDTQKEISKKIQFDVNCATENLSVIDGDLKELQYLVSSLDMKMMSLEDKQNLANMGVAYLCKFVDSGGKKTRMPKALEDQMKFTGRTRSAITYSDIPTAAVKYMFKINQQGLKALSEDVSKVVKDLPSAGSDVADGSDEPRVDFSRLIRANSSVC